MEPQHHTEPRSRVARWDAVGDMDKTYQGLSLPRKLMAEQGQRTGLLLMHARPWARSHHEGNCSHLKCPACPCSWVAKALEREP